MLEELGMFGMFASLLVLCVVGVVADYTLFGLRHDGFFDVLFWVTWWVWLFFTVLTVVGASLDY